MSTVPHARRLAHILPSPTAGKPQHVELHYFAGRGIGELIRLVLTAGGVPFVDNRYTKEVPPLCRPPPLPRATAAHIAHTHATPLG